MAKVVKVVLDGEQVERQQVWKEFTVLIDDEQLSIDDLTCDELDSSLRALVDDGPDWHIDDSDWDDVEITGATIVDTDIVPDLNNVNCKLSDLLREAGHIE